LHGLIECEKKLCGSTFYQKINRKEENIKFHKFNRARIFAIYSNYYVQCVATFFIEHRIAQVNYDTSSAGLKIASIRVEAT